MTAAVHHEWGALREAVVGIAPRDAFVLPRFSAEVSSWALPEFAALSRRHGGRRLLDVAPELAVRMERQAEAFAARLESYGVTVHRAEDPGRSGASSLFPRDLSVVVGERRIEASMRSPDRREEVLCVRRLLASLDAEDAAAAPAPAEAAGEGAFLEGGDVLVNGAEVYVGDSGWATDERGIRWLRELLGPGYRVHRIGLAREAFHLDCALALVRPGLGLVCRERILGPEPLPGELAEFELLEVTPEEADRLATNLCAIDDRTLVVPAGAASVTERLRRRGLTVDAIPYDGPILRGGGLRCSHLALARDSRP